MLYDGSMQRHFLLLCLLAMWFVPGGVAWAESGERGVLGSDWSAVLPQGQRDVDVALRLVDVRPLPGKGGGDEAGADTGGAGGDVVVVLRRRDGKWVEGGEGGHIVAADYNQKSENTADPSRLKYEDGKLSGTLRVSIGADSPRPGAKGFPNPADEYVVEIDAAVKAGEVAGYEPDREAFMPPWRKDVPTYGGKLIAGTYKASLKPQGKAEEVVEGRVTGAVVPAVVPGRWGTTGAASISAADEGMRVTVSLAPDRVMPPSDGWAVLEFDQPRDPSGVAEFLGHPSKPGLTSRGLTLTVDSPQRRDDAAVALAVQIKDGGWSQVTSAGLLLGREATFHIPWSHFRPALSERDATQVEAVRIGVDNAHGVGDVTFTVRHLAGWWDGTVALPGSYASPSVRIDPDTVDSLNAADDIPKGLFGFHTVHWPKKEGAEGKPDPLQYMRDTNPGFLRPLEHTGFGGKPMSDEEVAAAKEKKAEAGDWVEELARAGNAADNMVWTYTEDLWNRPSWMGASDQEKYLAGVRAWWRNTAARAWTPGDEHNLKRRFEVWNEPFMWGRHINMGVMNPDNTKAWRDPTQYGYLPGTLGAEMYADIYNAAKEGATSANEHVELGGPSSPGIDGNMYGVLEDYLSPFLAKSADKLDFFTEHHYGGDPAANAASYEVLTAYTDIKHNRRIPVYNTEANNLGASPAGKARYNIADILYAANTVPDKLRGRALHALWSGYLNDEGEEHAYRLMSTLRGQRLVSEVKWGEGNLLATASHPKEGKLVVLVLNEARHEMPVRLERVDGFEVAGVTALIADAPEHELRMRDVDGAEILKPVEGKTVLKEVDVKSLADPLTFQLPAGSAVRWTLMKKGYEPTKRRTRTQHFADAVLAAVTPGGDGAVEAKVMWRPYLSLSELAKARADLMSPEQDIRSSREKARRAFLRIITRDVHEGEAVAMMGGKDIPLPWSSSNDGQAVVQEIEIDPSLIRGEGGDTITFRVTDPARFNGYTVYAASVVLEQ